MLIREADLSDARAIAEVHVDSWRTTYSGMLPDTFLSSLRYDVSEERNRAALAPGDRELWTYVAVDDLGSVVGFARGGRERSGHPDFSGEIYAIYLRRSAQRSGAGRALLLALARTLLDHGMTSMLIWVLQQNPSRHFYEACGGTIADRKQEPLAGLLVDEIGYGWDDLAALVECGARAECYGETKKKASPRSA